MSRQLGDLITASLSKKQVQPFFAVKMMFDTSPLKFWTGLGQITIGDDTYTGSGNFLQISQVSETAEISAQGATLTLSGIPSSLLSLALSEPYQGRLCTILFGVINTDKVYLLKEDGTRVLAEDSSPIDITPSGEKNDLVELFVGYMDMMNIQESGDTCTISLAVESRLIDLERLRPFRFTDQNQKTRFPNDRGFEFVEALQDKRFTWGRK